MKPEASVIIPMYNSQMTIRQTLAGLESQTNKNFEIIIVDDGSTDSSHTVVKEFIKRGMLLPVDIIRQKNSGASAARNAGAARAHAKVIIFLDSDCIVPENWIQVMTETLKGNVAGCNCVCKVKNAQSLIARYVDYEVSRRHERMIGKNVNALSTGSASFIKSIFEEAGGFDISYTAASGEDFDLCFKIRDKGYHLLFTDKTFYHHYHPDTLKKYLRQQYYRGYWRVKMYQNNKTRVLEGDSYTGMEAQAQFLLSNLALASLLLAFAAPFLPIIGFGGLLLANLPLGLWSYKREKKFLLFAPVIASLRSLAGTIGVYAYIINKVKGRKETK